MANIRQIMKLLNVSEEAAFRIFDNMFIDFSECTSAEFKRAATEAKKKLGL